MSAEGSLGPFSSRTDFVRCKVLPALGHIISCGASATPCVDATPSQMWAAFYGSLWGKAFLGEKRSMRLIARSVEPLLRFRIARWPLQRATLEKVQHTQHAMIARVPQFLKHDGEGNVDFFTRKNRCASIAIEQKRLHNLHKQAVANWASRASATPIAGLLAFCSGTAMIGWQHAARLSLGAASRVYIRCRRALCRVHKRWAESLRD